MHSAIRSRACAVSAPLPRKFLSDVDPASSPDISADCGGRGGRRGTKSAVENAKYFVRRKCKNKERGGDCLLSIGRVRAFQRHPVRSNRPPLLRRRPHEKKLPPCHQSEGSLEAPVITHQPSRKAVDRESDGGRYMYAPTQYTLSYILAHLARARRPQDAQERPGPGWEGPAD